jgi:hypothetical protein
VITDIAEHLTMTKPVLLTEDYNARVEATQRGIEALSVHKLLSLMVRGGRLPPADAEIFAERLRKAGRAGHGYTAVEFASGDLGRVGGHDLFRMHHDNARKARRHSQLAVTHGPVHDVCRRVRPEGVPESRTRAPAIPSGRRHSEDILVETSRRFAAKDYRRSCRAITIRWTWLVPS